MMGGHSPINPGLRFALPRAFLPVRFQRASKAYLGALPILAGADKDAGSVGHLS